MLLDGRWNYRDASVAPTGRVQHFAGSPKPWQTKASEVTSIGMHGWHRALARSGFVASPPTLYSRVRNKANVRLAQLERRIRRLVHRP